MIEDRVNALEVEVAVLKTNMVAMTKAVEKNTEVQEELLAVFNHAKGFRALGIMIFMAVAFIIDILFRVFGK